jgi:hypothetical protein
LITGTGYMFQKKGLKDQIGNTLHSGSPAAWMLDARRHLGRCPVSVIILTPFLDLYRLWPK